MKWLQNEFKYGACNVEDNYNFYFKFLLSKLHQLFVWSGLPETISETWLNNNLFLSGLICFTEFNGKLYALNGGQSGVNAEYAPTTFTIGNPVLDSKICTVDKDCVIMYNDPTDIYFPMGLYQLINTTATMLADNVVSINTCQINTRVQAIVTADTSAERVSAEIQMKKLYSGVPFTVVEQNLLDKINVNPISNTNNGISDLIELQQYIIGTFFQNIGIKLNAVNKKERLITDEVESVDNYLKISAETMLKSRQDALKKINAMFGTNISVKLNPIIEQSENDNKQETESADNGESETIQNSK